MFASETNRRITSGDDFRNLVDLFSKRWWYALSISIVIKMSFNLKRFLIDKTWVFVFLLRHPLNRGRRLSALKRYALWQIGSRCVPGDVVVPFVDKTFLRMGTGMTGATGNVYVGLYEFEDMGFLLHVLRSDDLFVDIGANIGSYTVLAGGAVGAKCISVEPISSTFSLLTQNVSLNKLNSRVESLNIGIGREKGTLTFTTGLDSVNHVLADGEINSESMDVEMTTLDGLLEGKAPALIKVDVEGFETNVIAGADRVLSSDKLLAVIMELNGSGKRYGFDETTLHRKMLSYGFETYTYDPLERRLISLEGEMSDSGNTLYLRSLPEVSIRVEQACRYWIANSSKEI